MKRMKTKILDTALTLVLTSSLLLSGCSGSAKEPPETSKPEETAPAEEKVNTEELNEALKSAKAEDISGALSGYYLEAAVKEAEDLLNGSPTQKEVSDMAEKLNAAKEGLYSHADFKDTSELESNGSIRDPFLFVSGGYVESKEEWIKRAEEISAEYQHYMYGKWRDGSDEEISYTLTENSDGSYLLKMDITRISTGSGASFTATAKLPDESVSAPEGGYPVIVGMHAGISEDTATALGYAVITVDGFSYPVASDDTQHKGAFYDLYPYSKDDPDDQTGVLAAWGWGCSKILDALEAGAGEELNINPENSIVTGVSRWGKAAMVCGAFERRFKMVAPSCSGAGGVALYRYKSEGKTYDFSSKGADSKYTYGQNEPLGSLQSTGERGWFNDMFLKFKNPETLPMDQHELCSLVAENDRYLFIIGSCIYEDWVNAPAMWQSYLGAREVFDALGLADNIAINIHKEGHAVIPEDVEKMVSYFNYHVYGKEPDTDLDELKTSVFDLEENRDPDMENYWAHWIRP